MTPRRPRSRTRAALCLMFMVFGCDAEPAAPLPDAPPLHDPVGDWAGEIETPMGAALPFVIHIAQGDEGVLSGTADSPQQQTFGIPITSIEAGGDTVRVNIAKVRGTFEGRYTDAQTLDGYWEQGGVQMKLTLARGGAVDIPKRPQTPMEPFPYTVEDITIPMQSHQLSATLTLPGGEGPFPAAILITGSGPQDRDETLMGHKPFWVLADHLSRNGIAVLRYDDRGVGQSTGDFANATSRDFGDDAVNALAALRARPEVDRVGIIGHSEGGMIAPIIADESKADFLVLLAAPAVPIIDLLVAQADAVAQASGTAGDVKETQRALLTLVQKGDTPDNRKQAAELIRQSPGADKLSEPALKAQLDQLFSVWTQWFVQYDPAEDLSGLRLPVYALWGTKDVQVLSEQNAPLFQRLTAESPNAKAEVFEGLNHLFQPAETGNINEYAKIETTIEPAVLQKITSWINALP